MMLLNLFLNRVKPLTLSIKRVILVVAVTGCSVGPDFKTPQLMAPQEWPALHSGDASLQAVVKTAPAMNPVWWEAYHDEVLNQLVHHALKKIRICRLLP